MAVYTPVAKADLESFLSLYDIGTLVSYEGIEQGVSNTNYHLFTDSGRYILTLFEPHRVKAEEIPLFMDYTICLEKEGIPCPKTLLQKDGSSLGQLMGRPAAILSFLEGQGGSVGMLTPALCEKAGAVLARMHLASSKCGLASTNHFGLDQWKDWVTILGPKMNTLAPGLYDTTKEELDWIVQRWPSYLPGGAVHADYFPDNVFFKEGDVSGVIDFHFVCHDLFAYDLAIAFNAWSFDAANMFDPMRMDAMMRGYQSVRPLSQVERESLPVLLRAASMRFLLSRIEEKLAWMPDNFMKPHDPMVFEKRLRHFQNYNLEENNVRVING